MSNFTPGPYRVGKDHRIYSGHTPLAQVLAWSRPLEQKHNEALFAAAPELYAALDALLEQGYEYVDNEVPINICRACDANTQLGEDIPHQKDCVFARGYAALKKARGES